jgi:hypothetical protein
MDPEIRTSYLFSAPYSGPAELWGRLRISVKTLRTTIQFPLTCRRNIFHGKSVPGRAKLPNLPNFRHYRGVAKSWVSSLSSSYGRIHCEKISRSYRTSRNKLHLLPDGETITPVSLVDNSGHTVNRCQSGYLPIFRSAVAIGDSFCFKLERISRSLVTLGSHRSSLSSWQRTDIRDTRSLILERLRTRLQATGKPTQLSHTGESGRISSSVAFTRKSYGRRNHLKIPGGKRV